MPDPSSDDAPPTSDPGRPDRSAEASRLRPESSATPASGTGTPSDTGTDAAGEAGAPTVSGPAPRRRGRPAGARAGAQQTQEAILTAARTEFAAQGYAKASMRGIARTAGVDPSLLHHYFGSKEQLFTSALEVSFAPSLALPTVLAGGVDGLGERLLRFFLSLWEAPEIRDRFLAVLRSAFTEERAAGIVREFVTRELMEKIAAQLDAPDARLRVELAAAQLVGLAVTRYVIRIEPLASAEVEDIVRLVAPTIQRYLTEG